MSFLLLNVDKTSVTYDDWFIYTIDISFSGLYAPLNPVLLTTTVPDTLEYILPSTNDVLKSITEAPVTGGTEITFDFGTLNNTGIAVSLPLKCRFKLSAPDTSSVILAGNLYINSTDSPYAQANAPETILSIVPYYTLSMNTVVPNGTSAASGSSVIYEVLLENTGDQWKEMNNIVLTFDLSQIPEMTLDTSFQIEGEDISGGRYADTRNDGVTGVIFSTGDGFTFSLSQYKGQKYRLYFRAFIAENIPVGTNLSWSGTWSIDGSAQLPAQDILRIVSPEYSAFTETSGPLQIQPGNYAYYSNSSRNSGNQNLSNVMLEFELPANNRLIDYTLETGTFAITPINIPLEQDYLITYVTTDGSEYPLISPGHETGYYPASTSSSLILADIIPADRQVHYLRWNIGNFPVGAASLNAPVFHAYAADDLIMGTEILFHSSIYWDNADGSQSNLTDNFTTPVSMLSELYTISHTVSPTATVVPGDVLTFATTVSAQYSQLNDPVLMNIISDKVALVQSDSELINNIYLEYYDGLTGVTINSIDNADIFPFPYAELIPNYNNTSDALLRLSYKDDKAYSFSQNSLIKFAFDTKVNIGALGSFTNRSIIGNYGPFGSVSQSIGVYSEGVNEDIDGDGSSSEQLALSQSVVVNIEDFGSLEITKASKGSNDENYSVWPDLALGVAGGTVNYKLTILNNGNRPLDSIELVDIIPHIGDTGVIVTSQPRGSEFPIYQVADVQTELIDSMGLPVSPAPDITVYYSSSYDPVRFGRGDTEIGSVNDWSPSPPSPITEIGAYKVITSGQSIAPGSTLIITVVSIIPLGVVENQTAWNSFAVKASYTDSNGISVPLLPVEPQKAGVMIAALPNTGTISGRTFFDDNKNGLFDVDEDGLNDITVVLYKLTGDGFASLVTSTITTPNIIGENGYYVFSGLEPGEYILRFIPDFNKYTYGPSQPNEPMGSIVNPSSGYSPIVTVIADSILPNLFAGFINFRTSDFILRINEESHKMLKNSIYSQILLTLKLEETLSLIDILSPEK